MPSASNRQRLEQNRSPLDTGCLQHRHCFIRSGPDFSVRALNLVRFACRFTNARGHGNVLFRMFLAMAYTLPVLAHFFLLLLPLFSPPKLTLELFAGSFDLCGKG